MYIKTITLSGFALLLFAVLSVNNTCAAQHLESGIKKIQLIELYTSEGCSSCPAADLRIGELLNDHSLWNTRIPLAFHVDYWDYIGWKDTFANAKYSRRQRKHQSVGNIRSVYTPGFVVDGNEWTGFFDGAAWPKPLSDEPGNLQIDYSQGYVEVNFLPGSTTAKLINLRLALLGVGLASEVKRGENKGLTLQHNFVVLRLSSSQLSEGEGYHQNLIFDSSGLPQAEKYALVVWLEDTKTGKPVQAVGGWIEL